MSVINSLIDSLEIAVPKRYKNTHYNINNIRHIVNNEYVKTIKKLEEENRILKLTIKENAYEVEKNKQFKLIVEKIKNIGKDIKEKVEFIISFDGFVEKYLTSIDNNIRMNVFGSFTRQLFEALFNMSSLTEMEGYGNTTGHDIDIYLYESNPRSNEMYSEDTIKEFVNKMKQYVKIYSLSPDTVPKPKIGPYTLINIEEKTITQSKLNKNSTPGLKILLNIPHYSFEFINSNNKLIVVEVIAWKPPKNEFWNNIDFDVNSFVFDKFGISTSIPNMFNVIGNIMNKNAECMIELDKLNNYCDMPITRAEKVPMLLQLGYFLTERLKISSVGYKNLYSLSGIPVIATENVDDCPITSCKAPYINIKLVCGHEVSVHYFIRELKQGGNEYSEALSCPFCRGNLKLQIDYSDIIFEKPIFAPNIDLALECVQLNSKKNCTITPQTENTTLYSDDVKEHIRTTFSLGSTSSDERVSYTGAIAPANHNEEFLPFGEDDTHEELLPLEEADSEQVDAEQTDADNGIQDSIENDPRYAWNNPENLVINNESNTLH
jgi:hypothetical protein